MSEAPTPLSRAERCAPSGTGAWPPPDAPCIRCRGTDRWGDKRSWACATCHPDPRVLAREWEAAQAARRGGG